MRDVRSYFRRDHRATPDVQAVVSTALCVAAAAHVIAYGIVAVNTLGYPYVLEWMEGGSVDAIARVARGEPLYVQPSLEYVPHLYPPLYYWVAGAAAQLAEPSLLLARSVSLVSTLLTTGTLALFAYRETGKTISAVAAGALFLASFEISGRWFHLARVDSLYVLFLVTTIYLLRFHRGHTGTLAAGALFALAALTKQAALVALGPVLLVAALEHRRRALELAVGVLGLVGVGVLLHWQTGGWFSYFVLRLPLRHPLETGQLVEFWTVDLAAALPLALCCALAALVAPWPGGSKRRRLYLATLFGFIASAWLSRLHSGGYVNVLLPAYAALALVAGLAPGRSWPRPERGARWLLRPGLTCAVTVQLALLLYDPASAIPTAADRQANARLASRLARIDGEVLVVGQSYLPQLAQKNFLELGMAARDVLRSEPGDWVTHRLRRARDRAVAQRRFAAILLSRRAEAFPALAHYRLAEELHADGEAGRPIAGVPYRPRFLYLPRDAEP